MLTQTLQSGTPVTLWTSPMTWIVVGVAVLLVLFLTYLFRPRRSNLLREDFYAGRRERNDMLEGGGRA
ncbi:MAG: hypothetical protein JO359_06585 [Candidatus Eremiobacteraeota bacterium]|nr:hypothetical protein [Candidatus Eremiobacteraeota bacterium]